MDQKKEMKSTDYNREAIRIEGLVFDMDGLIFDSERIVQRSWNLAGEAIGIPKVGDHIYHTLGFNVVRREQYFREHICPDFPMEEFQTQSRQFFRRIADTEGVPRKEGVVELLRYAKEHGIKTAVATSSRREYASELLKQGGVYDFFDGFVYGDMVTHAKPDPEIYVRACEMLQVDPHHCLALEDAPAGIRSSYEACMMPVMIPDLVQPDDKTAALCFRQYSSLLDVLAFLKERM